MAKRRPTLLVFGGRGRMGSFFVRFFRRNGYAVSVCEKGEARSPRQLQKFDLVLLAVSMDAATGVARQVGPHLRKDALLFDINSLKKDICAAMARSTKAEVLGLHPMFGPSAKAIACQKILYCPVRSGPRARAVLALLKRCKAEIVECRPEYHDQMMAYVQVLLHFTKVGYAAALRASGVPLNELLAFISPLSLLEMTMVARLFSQGAELCSEIQLKNPIGNSVRASLLKELSALAKSMRKQDSQFFLCKFKEVREYLGDFHLRSQLLSDAMLGQLVLGWRRTTR